MATYEVPVSSITQGSVLFTVIIGMRRRTVAASQPKIKHNS